MKKNLFWAALAGVVLVGCTSDEHLAGSQSGKKLSFDAPMMSNIATKAPGVTGELESTLYPVDESFSIFGIQYKGNFNGWESSEDVRDFWTNGSAFTSVVATHTGSSTGASAAWAPAGDYYWVNSPYELAFAAYSPSSVLTDNDAEEITYDASGMTIKNFKVQDDVANQYDLMYSNRIYACTRDKYENTGIPLKFNHALSSIVFAAIEEVEKKSYEITGVSLKGEINNKGTFNARITETAATTDAPYSETKEVPEWTNLTIADGTTSVTYTPAVNGGSYTVTGVTDEFTGGATAILAIPQDTPDDAIVTLNYTVTTEMPLGGSKVDNYTKDIKLSEFIIVGTEGDKIEKWKPGYRYIYTINFGGSKKIFFVPEINPWINGGTAIYTIK